MQKRVVITGMGTINPIGSNVEETWTNAVAGTNGIVKLNDEILESMGVHVAGTLKGYDPLEHFSKKEARNLDPVIQYAVVAARQAYEQANLDQVEDRYSIGTIVSSGIGGIYTIQQEITKANEKGYNRVSPHFIPNAIVNLVSGNVAIDLGLKGPCFTVVTACASGTDSIGQAFNNIQNGICKVVVAGASEASVNYIGLSGFNNLRALSNATDPNRASIPFDVERHGFVMGEGAGALVLEEYEHAIARGAKILGEVKGYFTSCDASHITAPDPEGKAAIYAMNKLVDGTDLAKIKYINVHGTSTPLNEKTECKIINEIFKDHKDGLNITSSKSMTGHLLGAAGAVEAIIMMKSINENIVTPTINTQVVDPELNIDIALETKHVELEYGISTSLGFGGHNSMLLFKEYDAAK